MCLNIVCQLDPKNICTGLTSMSCITAARQRKDEALKKAFSMQIDWRVNALPKTHSSLHLPTSPASRVGAFLSDIEAETVIMARETCDVGEAEDVKGRVWLISAMLLTNVNVSY